MNGHHTSIKPTKDGAYAWCTDCEWKTETFTTSDPVITAMLKAQRHTMDTRGKQ